MEELLTREANFSTVLLSVLFSGFLSNPLYLFCMILSAPYLLELISLLFPLFLTTCLLSAALRSTHQSFFCIELLAHHRGSSPPLASSITAEAAAMKLSSKKEELKGFEDLGVGEFLFGSFGMEIERTHDFVGRTGEKSAQMEDSAVALSEDVKQEIMEEVLNPVAVNPSDETREPKRSSGNCAMSAEDESTAGAVDNQNQMGASICSSNLSSNPEHSVSKEWKRTLGCRLLEERHGSRGMDSLWEVEAAEGNLSAKKNSKLSSEEDGGVGVAVVCCLHGLKLSVKNMSLGVGRRKLGNITKAMKRYGWLQRHPHVNKKVHNNGDTFY